LGTTSGWFYSEIIMNNLKPFNQNTDFCVDLNALNPQEELLRAQKIIADLKKSNEQKDEFVSLATHQIRSPLGAIRGYISLIIEGDYGVVSEELHEPLNIILKSVDTLGKTVNDFLDISRIDQGEMRYYKKDFDLTQLANEVVNEMKKEIMDTGLDFKINISTDPLIVHGDKTKLKHVLLNLVDNASKYTKTGFIKINLHRKNNDKVVFSIKDSGVGIKAKTMPLLFQKFSRCADASQTNILGTGLGLYIAKKMLEAQNGRIWAESEGENKGSQFYVELDLVK
jgi:signal transduction histidine kinase